SSLSRTARPPPPSRSGRPDLRRRHHLDAAGAEQHPGVPARTGPLHPPSRMARPPLAGAFMIVASSGQIAPVSGHDHEIRGPAARDTPFVCRFGCSDPRTADKGRARRLGGKAGNLSRPTASIALGLIMPLWLPAAAWWSARAFSAPRWRPG